MLTLTDVVESRTQQRASGARNALAETRDAAQSRRERFSLEESDRRAALDSQDRSSSIRADAGKARTARDEASKPQDKPVQADRSTAAKFEPDRQPRHETSTKPAPARPAAPARPGKPAADTAAAGQAGQETSKGATDETSTLASQGKGEAAAEAKTGTESAEPNAATQPLLAVFVAPPAATSPTPPSASTTGGSNSENESGVDAADGATESAGILDRGSSRATAAAAVAAKPGFEAALADIGAAAAGGDSVQSIATPSADPALLGGTAASSAADAKSTAPVHQQASTPTLPAPVPIGAVPMTIGLRALGTSNRFEIRLDPKELGRIDVSIDIDKDTGTVGARLVVDRPETLALLQRDASSLQQALSQTGLDASAGISLSLRGGEGEGEGHRSNGESGADSPARGNGQTDHAGARSGTETSPIDLMPLRALGGLGRVDIRI